MPSNISLNVTSQTTAAQLDDFAKQLGDGERLKGKKNDDGSITLYSSSSEPSLISKLSGRAEKRAAAAHEAINLVTKSNPHFGEVEKGDVKALLSRAAVSKPSTDALKVIANHLSAIEARAIANQKPADIPSMAELPFNARADLRDGAQALGGLISNRSQDKPAYDVAIRDMATGLAAALGSEPLASLFPNAALSDGTDLIEALSLQIQSEVTDPALGKAGKNAADGFAKQVFLKASDILLGASITPGSTDVVIDGTTYERREQLGNPGGFGTAYRYEATDGSGSIAVKFQNSDDPDKTEAFRQEIPAHKQASASGHENILKFHGAMRTETGGFAIASELATGGEAGDIAPTLLQMRKDGMAASSEAVNAVILTMLKDMGAGLLDMHATAGMSHLDFKPPNAFVSEDGFVKVADFGTAVTSNTPFLKDAAAVDQTRWRDATALFMENEMPDAKGFIARGKEMKQDDFAKAFFPESLVDGKYDRDAMRDNVSKRAVGFMNTLTTQFEKAATDEYLSTITFDGTAADMFSLGVTAINMLIGDDYLSGSQTGQFLTEVSADSISMLKSGVLPVGDHDGALRPSTGDQGIDDLLNALLNPDASQRPHDLDSLLALEAFQRPNVGSDSARMLLSGVIRGDTGMISEAAIMMD